MEDWNLEENYYLKRRQSEDHVYGKPHKNLEYRRLELKKQKEFRKQMRFSNDKYTFLQYLPLILNWLGKTKGVKQNEILLLLYLQPLMLFQKRDFLNACKQLGFPQRHFMEFKDKKLITRYTPDKTPYYRLTNKSLHWVTQLYDMTLMDKSFPMEFRHNGLVTEKEKDQDRGIMDSLLEFNKKVKEKAENKT
tara:strand:- start:46 stop:621 length:576 start_codon:yes stop_codon:yes gene_type:complete